MRVRRPLESAAGRVGRVRAAQRFARYGRSGCRRDAGVGVRFCGAVRCGAVRCAAVRSSAAADRSGARWRSVHSERPKTASERFMPRQGPREETPGGASAAPSASVSSAPLDTVPLNLGGWGGRETRAEKSCIRFFFFSLATCAFQSHYFFLGYLYILGRGEGLRPS